MIPESAHQQVCDALDRAITERDSLRARVARVERERDKALESLGAAKQESAVAKVALWRACSQLACHVGKTGDLHCAGKLAVSLLSRAAGRPQWFHSELETIEFFESRAKAANQDTVEWSPKQ